VFLGADKICESYPGDEFILQAKLHFHPPGNILLLLLKSLAAT